MKKLIAVLITFTLFISAQAQSCEGIPLLNEHFDNNSIPNNWTILNLDNNILYWNMPSKGYTGAWQPFYHLGRNGIACTSRFTPVGTADDYLITPQISLGNAPVCLSWKGSTFLGNGENYEIRISTTTPDATGMLANPPLAVINNDGSDWGEHIVSLSSYAGQNVYIGFWYNQWGGYSIFIDDIKISQPISVDVKMLSLNLPDVVSPGAQIINGTLLNGGSSTITSVDINWNVNNGPVNTMNATSVNITNTYNFTHSINWSPISNGSYLIKMWASNINGQPDQYTGNDTLAQNVFVNNFPRKVLIEEFTQASCPPCGTLNAHFDSVVQPNINLGKVSSIKYHCVWPGIDPMNAFNMGEVEERVQYYGIDAIPMPVVDGLQIPYSGCFMFTGGCGQHTIDSARITPSIFDIQLSDNIVGAIMNVAVIVTAKSNIPMSTFRLYVAVVEDTIIYNVAPGNNGETDFYQVMRKILPDSTGQPLVPMLNNQTITFNYSYPIDISTCMPSEMRSVAFIQDDATRHVYQSENTSSHALGISELGKNYDLKIFPNPSSGIVNIKIGEGSVEMKSNLELYNPLGEKMLVATITHSFSSIDLTSLPKGIYFLKLILSEGIVTKKIVLQ